MEAPEALPEIRQVMEAQLDAQQSRTLSECVSPLDARNFAESLGRYSGNDNCDVTESEIADGSILMRGTCAIPGSEGPATLTMEGSYERTSLHTDITLEMNAPTVGPVTVRAELNGTHEGECES